MSDNGVIIVAGNATYKSLCRSVGWLVGRSVLPTLLYLKVDLSISGTTIRIITTPAKLITAPAPRLATKVAVYTTLFFFFSGREKEENSNEVVA